jgi:hypothetical protein
MLSTFSLAVHSLVASNLASVLLTPPNQVTIDFRVAETNHNINILALLDYTEGHKEVIHSFVLDMMTPCLPSPFWNVDPLT